MATIPVLLLLNRLLLCVYYLTMMTLLKDIDIAIDNGW